MRIRALVVTSHPAEVDRHVVMMSCRAMMTQAEQTDDTTRFNATLTLVTSRHVTPTLVRCASTAVIIILSSLTECVIRMICVIRI